MFAVIEGWKTFHDEGLDFLGGWATRQLVHADNRSEDNPVPTINKILLTFSAGTDCMSMVLICLL